MKRRELVLDFTSLLDVILILLFIVTSSIGQTSKAATEQAQAELAETQAQVEALSGEKTALAGEKDALTSELSDLQDQYAQLQDDYDYLKITSGYDAGDTAVYEQAVERMTQVVLDCKAVSEGERPQVEVGVYVAPPVGSGQSTFAGSGTIVHDFSLSKPARDELVSRQVTELAKTLADALKEDDSPMIWFSIQYRYDDENFTRSDLEVIRQAIDRLETAFGKPCYTGECKLW